MTDFVVWRSCVIEDTQQLTSALNRFSDAAQRATALLESPNGLPDSPGQPAGANNGPTLDILSSSWSLPIPDPNSLITTAGTYTYAIVPVDDNGMTGPSYDLASLTIGPGQRSILTVAFNGPVGSTISAYLIRNGLMVGPIWPLGQMIVENSTILNGPDTTSDGTYTGLVVIPLGSPGAKTTFNIATGSASAGQLLMLNGTVPAPIISKVGTLCTTGPLVPAPPASGSFKNTSVLASSAFVSNGNYTWQYVEDGRYANRSGSGLADSATAAFGILNNLLIDSGYDSGAAGFINNLRGLESNVVMTDAQRAVRLSGGRVARPTGSLRAYAINASAQVGTSPVNMDVIRALLEQFVSPTALRDSAAQSVGVGVAIYRQVAYTITAAACPPGQAASTAVRTEYVGQASVGRKLVDGETASILWTDPYVKSSPQGRSILLSYGLTEQEASLAGIGVTTGRVVAIGDLSVEFQSLAAEFIDDQITEMADDPNIDYVDTGLILGAQIDIWLADRTPGGIVDRDGSSDVCLPLLQTIVIVLDSPSALGTCFGLDGLVQQIQQASAAFFAAIEGALQAIVDPILAFARSLLQPVMDLATSVITILKNVIDAVSNNKPLGRLLMQCLLGTALQLQLPGLRGLLAPLQFLADSLKLQFSFMSNGMSIITGIICALVEMLRGLLPVPALVGSMIDCAAANLASLLPPDLLALLDCNLNIVASLDSLLAGVLAELNEFVLLIDTLLLDFSKATSNGASCSGPQTAALSANLGLSLGSIGGSVGVSL